MMTQSIELGNFLLPGVEFGLGVSLLSVGSKLLDNTPGRPFFIDASKGGIHWTATQGLYCSVAIAQAQPPPTTDTKLTAVWILRFGAIWIEAKRHGWGDVKSRLNLDRISSVQKSNLDAGNLSENPIAI